MKRCGWILLLLLMAAAPARPADKKITAQELKDMLTSDQQQKKSDDAVATELKTLEISEELTPAMLNSLGSLVPGQQSLAQVYILEARSAMLPPPAADLPADPAPDAATQKAILDKASDYASKTYSELPEVTATKTTIRFQDNMQTIASSSGIKGSAVDVSTSTGLSDSPQFFRFLGTADTTVDSDKGVEKMPAEKDKTPWGANRMIAPEEQGPVLTTELSEAQAAGKITWLRWEMVNGKKTAVFSFTVDKKKSRYAVNYCCYPDTDQAGVASFQSSALGSAHGSGGGGAHGNFQTNTSWKPWKSTVGYHGELFVNPDTGIVVRLISEAEFKPSDIVHHEDTRIDYEPVTVADKTLVLPVKSFTNTEDVPKGEDYSGSFSLRHTLFYTEYKNYQLAGAAH
jgi:hypothetical protein